MLAVGVDLHCRRVTESTDQIRRRRNRGAVMHNDGAGMACHHPAGVGAQVCSSQALEDLTAYNVICV